MLQTGDYYLENGKYVLTESYLARRGFCCKNGCRHCPYISKASSINKTENNDDSKLRRDEKN